MKIKDIVQTVILICCLIMLPVLGLAYACYSQTTISSLEALDKSFSVMIGVFGGTATLAAAYIASLLFNDWREKQKHENAFRFAEVFLSSYKKFELEFSRLFDVFILEKENLKVQLNNNNYDFLLTSTSNLQDFFYIFHNDLILYLYVAFPLDDKEKLILPIDVDTILGEFESNIHDIKELVSQLDNNNPEIKNLVIIKQIIKKFDLIDVINFDKAIKYMILKPLKLER